MRKLTKISALLLAMVFMFGFQSCHKYKKGDVLNYVPEDVTLLVYMNTTEVSSQLGVSEDGTIGEPLKGLLEKNGADLDELQKGFNLMKDFSNETVVFIKDKKLWGIGGLKSTKNLIKYLKNEKHFDENKEDGVKFFRTGDGTIMIKDNMIFTCLDLEEGKFITNTSGVKELCKLKKSSFGKSEKTKSLAENIVKGDYTLYFLANFNKIAGMARTSEFDQFMSTLSMIYDDPTYATADLKLTDKGIFINAGVLNKNFSPAKCNISLGQIDLSELRYASVQGNNVAVALSLPSQLISQIDAVAGKYLTTEQRTFLNSINGTVGLTLDVTAATKDNAFALMGTATSPAATDNITKFLQQLLNNKALFSTSGNYIRMYPQGGSAQPSGDISYASALNGKAAGAVADLGAIAQSMGLRGNIADLGTLCVYVDPSNNSLTFKAEWNCSNPIQHLIDLFNHRNQVFDAIDNLSRYSFVNKRDYDDYSYDSYDSYGYDEYAAPEAPVQDAQAAVADPYYY